MSQVKQAPVVAVLNMKGGVGKTTISAHLLRVVYQRAKRNCLLIDLDPQFNLTQVLLRRQDYEPLRDAHKTIYSVMEEPTDIGLFVVTPSQAPAPDPKTLAKEVHSYTSAEGRLSLDLIPGDFALVKYSLMDHDAKLGEVQKRFLEFVELARANYGLVCIDCNPSSSFITSCAVQAATHLLIPVKPDLYSVIGVELLHKLLSHQKAKHPKPATIILLNNLQGRAFDAKIENELRGHPTFGREVLAGSLRYSKLLVASPSATGFATDRRGPWPSRLYNDLLPIADELVKRLGL